LKKEAEKAHEALLALTRAVIILFNLLKFASVLGNMMIFLINMLIQMKMKRHGKYT